VPPPPPLTPHPPGEEPSKGLLDESITFTAPGIGSYYFSMAAVTRVAQHMVDNPLAMYRLVPGAGLPSKAPPPQMTVNLPPNATQAQRMQVRVGGVVVLLRRSFLLGLRWERDYKWLGLSWSLGSLQS
jgi:hypothetical protein